MPKCILDGELLPEINVYLMGFECRKPGRYCCHNFMHSMVNGRNCRLLKKNPNVYSKLSARSVLEPIKEVYKNKDTETLTEMFEEIKEKYRLGFEANSQIVLRAQLGAIQEILEERENASA